KAIRELGNVGAHSYDQKMKITAADVYQSLSQLTYILEWYFEHERPDALVRQEVAAPAAPPPAGPVAPPSAALAPPPAVAKPKSAPQPPPPPDPDIPGLYLGIAKPKGAASPPPHFAEL